MDVDIAQRKHEELVRDTMPEALSIMQSQLDDELVKHGRAVIRIPSEYGYMGDELLEAFKLHYENHGWDVSAVYPDIYRICRKPKESEIREEHGQRTYAAVIIAAIVVIASLAVGLRFAVSL